MDDSKRMEIERACERLMTLYCHYVDHGEASRIAELFTKDGVWRSPENAMEGVDAIRQGFGVRESNLNRMSRHVCNNALVDVQDEDNAVGCVYLTLYRHDGEAGRSLSPLRGPLMVGEYRDRFVRTEEGWLFAERIVETSLLVGAPTP